MLSMFNTLRLEVTTKCNLACRYCHSGDTLNRRIKEFSVKELVKIISEAKRLGCKEVIFIGGEPLVYKNFWELVKLSPIKKIIITTNATLFDKNNISKLVNTNKIKELRISIDGFASNDKYRIGSSYKDLFRKIKVIKNKTKGVRMVIQTTCHKGNINELMKLYNALKKLNIDNWRLSIVWNLGRARNSNQILLPDFKELVVIYKNLIIRYLKDNKPFELEIYDTYNSNIGKEKYDSFALDSSPCSYYSDTLCVCADRSIIYCPKYKEEKKFFKDSIIKYFLKKKYFECKLTKIKVKDLRCKECRYLKLCGGGCRANSLLHSGNLLGKDPVACNILPLVEKYIVPILPSRQSIIYEKNIIKNKKFPQEIF